MFSLCIAFVSYMCYTVISQACSLLIPPPLCYEQTHEYEYY